MEIQARMFDALGGCVVEILPSDLTMVCLAAVWTFLLFHAWVWKRNGPPS